MSALAKIIRDHYRDLDTIEVKAPWRPSGVEIVLVVRPHHDSDYLAAIEALDVRPRTATQRKEDQRSDVATKRRVLRAKLATKGNKGGDAAAHQAAQEELAALEAASATDAASAGSEKVEAALAALQAMASKAGVAAADGVEWDQRYPTYTDAELAKVRDLVAQHLVVSIEQVDGEERRPWTPEEIAAAFASTDPIPVAFPDAPDAPVAFSGLPEGSGWARVVLTHSVREHLFHEARGPLAHGSSDSEPCPATSPADETSPKFSEPA